VSAICKSSTAIDVAPPREQGAVGPMLVVCCGGRHHAGGILLGRLRDRVHCHRLAPGRHDDYSIHTDVKYEPLEVIEAGRLADECKERWWNQTLCRVNDWRGAHRGVPGEFHWHKHDQEDELFYVVEGKLLLDLEGRTVELAPRQGSWSRAA